MSMMLARAVKAAAVARSAQRGVGVAALETRAFANDASSEGGDKRQQRPRKTNNGSQQQHGGKGKFFSQEGEKRSERKFSFALKDKQNKNDGGARKDYGRNQQSDRPQSDRHQSNNRKKFSFAPSVKAKEKEPELEHFDAPAYWNEDFPADFDDSMKHEVEKLEVFADFTMLIDSSWQQQIHPLFDGSTIELTLNAPLEDFDERLFIDDKNTYDTKVVMEVPMACFKGLTAEGLKLVEQLAGPRYNANKKQLKLTEDRYATRVHNHKRLCDILRDLTQTAHDLATAQAAKVEQ